MTKKLQALVVPAATDGTAYMQYANTFTRYVNVKEEQAELAKRELLILWTDYFKPAHVEAHPSLHELFWQAAKQCSACKQHIDVSVAEDLLATVRKVHELFWSTKRRDVAWVTAG